MTLCNASIDRCTIQDVKKILQQRVYVNMDIERLTVVDATSSSSKVASVAVRMNKTA